MVNSTGMLADTPLVSSPGPLARTLLASWPGMDFTLKGLVAQRRGNELKQPPAALLALNYIASNTVNILFCIMYSLPVYRLLLCYYVMLCGKYINSTLLYAEKQFGSSRLLVAGSSDNKAHFDSLTLT